MADLRRRAGADHVTHVGDQVALLLQVFDELHRAALAVFLGLEGRVGTGVLQHGQVVQRDVGAAPGVGAGDRSSVLVSPGTLNTVTVIFFSTSGRLVNHSASAQLCITSLALALPALAFFGDVVEVVEHQQGLLQRIGSHTGHFGVVEQVDQGWTL